MVVLIKKKTFINERNQKIGIRFSLEYVSKDTSWYIIFYDESKYNICDTLQEKVMYVANINFEFFTKLGSEYSYQHVPKEYKAYCSIEPEK